MLTSEDKSLLRTKFKLMIHESDGQAFQDLFTSIMVYAEPDFKQIKPWGNIGDMKNDGYIHSKGIYYQVYGPEEITESYPRLIEKLETDFAGLVKKWAQPINEFYFVVNEKFKGVNPASEQLINKIIKDNKLRNGGFLIAKDLENKLFSLRDDQITEIVGFPPKPGSITVLNFAEINEVIEYIMKLPLPKPIESEIKYPDWDEKIKFNGLSNSVAACLNSGAIQVPRLEKYLNSQGDFLADKLRDKMSEIYASEKDKYTGDNLFWKIIEKASPKNNNTYLSEVLVIMSLYFETCDIFERPPEDQNDSTN